MMRTHFDGALGLADTLHPAGVAVPKKRGRKRRRRRVAGIVLLLLFGLGASACALLRARPLLLTIYRYRASPEVVLVPVEGLAVSKIRSSWHAPRSGGRQHEGADLFAPKGTRVRAAVRGKVMKIRNGGLGGKSVTVLGAGPAFYYYAHLDTWAPGLRVGQRVRAGQTLGTVGNTGNAKMTPAHLHFGIYPLAWPPRWRRPVRPVDPVGILQAKGTPRRAMPSGRPSRDDETARQAWPGLKPQKVASAR